MKLHENGNTSYIINDTDIKMTGDELGLNAGYTLKTVLNDHSKKIEKLESNVKWMYRYGALGSGGTGTGSGNGSTSKLTVQIFKDGIQPISPGTKLMYPGENYYKFRVEIHGGGSDTFQIKYYYNNGKVLTRVVSKDNEFANEESLKLEGNNELTITIKNQSTGDFYKVNDSPNLTFQYITSAYNISANYVKGYDYVNENNVRYERFTPNNNIIFISDVADTGLMIALNYNIAVNLTDSKTYIEYNDWEDRDILINNNGMTIKYLDANNIERTEHAEFDLKLKSNSAGILYLPLASDIRNYLSEDSASFKQVTIKIYSQLADDVSDELSLLGSFNFNDNLIPNGLFLNIRTSAGKLYRNSNSADTANDENQITGGDILFKVTPYNGSLVPTRLYQLSVTVYDNNNQRIYTSKQQTLSEQKEADVIISISEPGVKKLEFNLAFNGVVTTYVYFIKIKEFISNFEWYPNIYVDDLYKETQILEPYFNAEYKRNFENKNISSDEIFISPKSNIQMTSNDIPRTIYFNYGEKYNNVQLNYYDLLFSLGIQYSSINNTKNPILSLNISTSTSESKSEFTIFLYQDKVSISTSKTNVTNYENIQLSSKNIDIFLPIEDTYEPATAEKYHLFNIYKRFETLNGTNYWKSINAYIDGVLDGALNEFVGDNLKYDSLTLYPGNYSINLFELSLFNHTNLSYDEINKRTWLTDLDINRYYKAYNEKIIYRSKIYNQNDFALFERFSQFRIDDKNRVIVDDDTAQNISKLVNCAVMQLYFDDNGTGIGEFNSHNTDNFIKWFERSYEENERTVSNIPVTVEYSSGDNTGLHNVTMPDGQIATFSINIQGSSTKTFRDKNLELYAPASSFKDGIKYDYIYSPNICKNTSASNYHDSFLPESSFTLKADVVDSSHTNNNAIGKFVNDNTTPFGQARNNSNQHGTVHTANIKNTLIGFPVLLFMHTRYQIYTETNVATGTYKNTYYFLGIYNFNLGRNSSYNLGYKDIANIEPLIDANEKDNDFVIYEIEESKNTQIDNVVGAEIQGNNMFFDFSQYNDNTVLFDPNFGMWGDFIGNNEENILQGYIKNLCRDVAYAGGYVFTMVGKHMSEDLSDMYGYDAMYSKIATDENGKTLEWVPNYHYQVKYEASVGTERIYSFIKDTYNGTETNLLRLILQYENETTQSLTPPRIDFTSVSEYFTTMMAMGLVDSPMKNLNVKSWNNGQTFYTAFYDMDTGLGKNNIGTYINYFAFSDYWKSKWEEIKNQYSGTLKQVEILRDYSPEKLDDDDKGGSSFFDVPSTYLFAVVKYTKSILSRGYKKIEDVLKDFENYSSIFEKDPSNIWGEWRKSNGCLRDAKHFMKTYFNDHLKDIPEEAFNFNYIYKYFVKNESNNGYDGVNFIKFHGRGKAYTENWLDSRLHILDAYFNLNGIDDTINIVNGVEIKAATVDNAHKPTDNKDVYVLQDAFTGSSEHGAYTKESNGNLTITAKEYAPLIIQYPQLKERYLFPSNGNPSEITLKFYSPQTCLFGGSGLWTSISSIAPFINDKNYFSIYSKYISTIIGTNRTCTSWNFEAPSLRILRLTSNNYSGEIRFESTDSAPAYQNLDEIDISNTGINLSLSNIPLRKLYALNMKTGANLNAIGCNRLEDVKISGNFNSISLSSWNNVSALPTGGNLTCETISITNDIERFPDASLYISNNGELKTINVSGFSHLYISTCPKLTSIIFNDIETSPIKTLDIQMPSFNDENTFTIGNTENIVDLSNFNNLTTLRLSNLPIKDLLLPTGTENLDDGFRKIILLPGAFYNCKNLETIQNEDHNESKLNKLYITGDSTFFNCGSHSTNGYKLIKYGKSEISNVYIDETCVSLKDTFNCTDGKGKITYAVAKQFLQERCTNSSVENVTNIDNMFRNNVIEYNYANFYSEYLSKTCSLPLYGFINCVSANDVFSLNSINFWNRYMFENADKSLFKNSDVLNLTTMCNTFEYGTIDILYPFINKTISIDFKQQSNIMIYNPSSLSAYSTYSKLILNNIFDDSYKNNESENIHPSKIISISNFTISSTYRSAGGSSNSQKFDFTGLFDNNKENIDDYVWTAADKNGIILQNFMNSTYKIDNYDSSSVNILFKNIVPTLIINSFGSFTSSENDILNIYTMFNWDKVKEKTVNLFSASYSGSPNISFGGLNNVKKCSYNEFNEIWDKLIESTKLTGVSSIFTDAIITDDDWNNKEFKLSNLSIINESITTVPSLFKNIKLMDTNLENGQYPIDIKSRLFKNLKNIKYVPSLFENTYMKHAIPFDVFAKRKKSSSKQSCFVKVSNNGNDSDYEPGKIIQYDYDNTIINMNRTFYNISFENKTLATFRHNNIDHNYNIFERNYAYAVSDQSTQYYKFYKKENDTWIEYDIEQPLEIQDIDKLWCDHKDIDLIKSDVKEYTTPNVYKSTYSKDITDYSKNGTGYFNLDNFCDMEDCGFVVSPDIFRCCDKSCTITDALKFDRGNNLDPIIMTGMMPPSIFKTDYLRTINFEGTFSGLNVSPIEMTYYDIDEMTVGGVRSLDNYIEEKTCTRYNTYYQYILDDFTERDSLSNSFNFTLLLPKSTSTYVEEGLIVYEKTRNSQMFFMFSDKSISKNTQRLSSTLPTDYNKKILEDYKEQGESENLRMHYYYMIDNGIYFNIMYSFIDTLDNDENVIKTFMTGIDKNTFRYLMFDNLISSDIAKIYKGNVLSSNNSWSQSNVTNDSSTVFYQVGGNNTGFIGLSLNAAIQAEYSNRGWFPRNGNGYIINKKSLPSQFEYNNSYIEQYWSNYNFMDYKLYAPNNVVI